jgi:hypothetical protein
MYDMTLDEILTHWEKDSKIDRTDISDESLKVPEIHHKYLKMLSMESLTLKKFKQEYKNMYRTKWEYYLGILDYDTMKEYSWEPLPLKILKQDVDIYISSDKELQAINTKVAIQEEKCSALESILKTISVRNFAIKNYIDYEKFQVGA